MATASWLNKDGLYIKYGVTEGTTAKGGEILGTGVYRVVEIPVVYTDFASAASIINDTLVIPKYARIDKVEVVTVTAFDSAADTFVANIGLINTDRTTEYDYDGLVAVLPQASMDPAGDYQTVDVNHTYKGAKIGTTMTADAYVTVDWDTQAPNAGAAKIRIYYYMAQNR